ncbi:MAG: hypothetical protein LBL69_05190 [Zoogloeaceae bacterium]|jgi:Tfp pilus assembly protein PilX|nr:hypothetical protein [Zoogloeaceae bacterium]
MNIHFPHRQRGVSIISAIIILVILMSLAAAFVSFGKQANFNTAQEVEAARIEYLAQAAAEIALYESDPTGSNADFPTCANVAQVMQKIDATVQLGVDCKISSKYDEGGKEIQVYNYAVRVGSAARTPPAMTDRRFEILFEKCRLSDGSTDPDTGSYDCAEGA